MAGRTSRFIIWRPDPAAPPDFSLSGALSKFPDVEIVSEDGDSAIVLTDDATAERLRRELTDCIVENDAQLGLAH